MSKINFFALGGLQEDGKNLYVYEIDEKIIIPMLGKTESLNASVATGVILYEYVRQKIDHWQNKNICGCWMG